MALRVTHADVAVTGHGKDEWNADHVVTGSPGGIDVTAAPYNAKGDGVTDDTAALNAAFADGVGYLPAGTYLVSPTASLWLQVGSGLTIYGDGPSSTIKVKADAGDYSTVFGPGPTLATAVSGVTFRDFRIAQNAAANTTCDLHVGDVSIAQFAIAFFNATDIAVEGMTFDACCGVNTVTVNGPTCARVRIQDNEFSFAPARTTDPSGEYDNSAVYVNAQDHVITGNRFRAVVADHARGAMESHSGRGVVSGNVSIGYETLCNVVTQATETPILADLDVVVAGNTAIDCGLGIVLWAATGYTLANVVVSDNAISVNNATRAAASHAGIALAFSNTGALNGAFEGVTIRGNVITFQAEERAGMSEANTGGILLYANGNITRVLAEGNTIRHAPTQGIRVHSVGGVASTVTVKNNVIVDAGNDSLATNGYRVGIALAGVVNQGSRVEDNVILDTGATSANGYYSIENDADTGSEVFFRNNVVRCVGPTAVLYTTYGGLGFPESLGEFTLSGNFAIVADWFDRYDLTIDGSTPALAITAWNAHHRYQRLTVSVVNASGGAGPTLTWTTFKMAPWANPANGKRITMEFEWDGAVFRERWRSGDVTN